MEREEDEDILRELRGEVMDTLVYELTDGKGQVVVGLSKVGVDRVAAEMALKGEVLREMNFRLIPGRGGVVPVVKAGRYAVSREGKEVLLETVFGTKRQLRRRRVQVYGGDGQPVMREGRPMVVAKNEQEEAGCLRRVAIAEVSLAPSLSVQLADCKQPTSRESGSEEPI